MTLPAIRHILSPKRCVNGEVVTEKLLAHVDKHGADIEYHAAAKSRIVRDSPIERKPASEKESGGPPASFKVTKAPERWPLQKSPCKVMGGLPHCGRSL
jgi:hypothetical protein